MTHPQSVTDPRWNSVQDANVTPAQDSDTGPEQGDSIVFGMDDYRLIMGDGSTMMWCMHCDDLMQGQGVVNGRLAEVNLTWSSGEQRVSILDLYDAAKLHHAMWH